MCNHGGMPPVEPLMDAAVIETHHHQFAGERLNVPEKVVISPCVGQFRASAPETVTSEGELIDSGQIIGYVEAQGRTVAVRSAFAGWMMGLMVHDGERVREGQPVAWLRAL
jgi:biotin carboxyl carrier protein